MGTVFLAEQEEPVRRSVALKIIRPGMDSAQVLARFESERQALALMDHPNIAKVHDAGTTPDRRPFFVMELVDGVALTQFCDDRVVPLWDQVRLLVSVCQAVQHAHQKGVIHRDLKPSNILVAEYDGKPTPKVIDFGVAKAIDRPLTGKTLDTGYGSVIGTPEYMSPEQAQLGASDVDTRSYIYALGVVLYELITGSPPLSRERVRDASLLEMLRLVREEDPPKPSTRLAERAAAGTAAVGRRPARLYELDWIVMKCLEKDRARRYESTSALAADLERYLADEPVLAGPPATWYRVRKFARRHRPVLAAGGLLAVVVVGAIGLLAASNARPRAEQKRTAAEQSDSRPGRR